MTQTARVPCPHCGYASSRTVGSLPSGGTLRRTRRCLRPPAQPGGKSDCGRGFCTYEVTTVEFQLVRAAVDLARKSLTDGQDSS